MFQKSKPLDVRKSTLENVDRFSKFFYRVIRMKILYVHITNISTSPAICCYTTLWKSKIQKCYQIFTLNVTIVAYRRTHLLRRHCMQLSIEAHTSTPPSADWKRPPGRPRRNWLQHVEEDIGLSVGAAWIAGQDRSMWRTLLPSAGQAQQWVSKWQLIRLTKI